MDRRSWLWRRKSSEKSPGETESSGSLSSQSEIFSGEQAYQIHITQSPEITSKPPFSHEETDDVKTLMEKLSEAMFNISAKEELVKEHAKVTEEAVAGWEKADNEVSYLKEQLEVATQKNSALGDRNSHLDGALKECVRQLRQAREEHMKKLHDVISKRALEWDLKKSDLEEQLRALRSQMQSCDLDLSQKLEAVQKENDSLKIDLLSRAEEVEIRIIERDLISQAAETASKQHLDTIKKVAKLEAELRKLKAMVNNKKSTSVSSVYIESLMDSQSDSLDRLSVVEADADKMTALEFNAGDPYHFDTFEPVKYDSTHANNKSLFKNFMAPLADINLMDDFLEMEKLAALPVKQNGIDVDQPENEESTLKAKLDSMIKQTGELETKLEKIETEKAEMESLINEYSTQLALSHKRLEESEGKLVELRIALARVSKLKDASNEEVLLVNSRREVAESRVMNLEGEIKKLLSKVSSLEENVESEQVLSNKHAVKCRKLEDELLRSRQNERALPDNYAAKCKKLEEEILEMKQNERALSENNAIKCKNLEDELLRMKQNEQALLDESAAKYRKLEEEVLRIKRNEQILSDENAARCRKLENDLRRMSQDAERHKGVSLNSTLKMKQDEELAVAASKFAVCQKTIASLGLQLKSLATFEDILLGSETGFALH